MYCIQPMPYKCRYCTCFNPDSLESPCSRASGKESWKLVSERYGDCKSFVANKEHCKVCSLRIKCLTGA